MNVHLGSALTWRVQRGTPDTEPLAAAGHWLYMPEKTALSRLPAIGRLSYPMAADLDGDGKTDLVAQPAVPGSSEDTKVTVFTSSGKEDRLGAQVVDVNIVRGMLDDVAVGDIDGDGVSEIIIAGMDRDLGSVMGPFMRIIEVTADGPRVISNTLVECVDERHDLAVVTGHFSVDDGAEQILVHGTGSACLYEWTDR